MGAFRQFWKQPQRVWLRKALFQVHLWAGIGAGLYVLVISVSGSVVVFRQDVFRAYESPVIHVVALGNRMNADEIKAAAKRFYPGYEVTQLYEFEDDLQRAVEVRLEKGRSVRVRLFDPYTGSDLGRSVPWQISIMSWFYDLHVELFGGRIGRQINAVGGILWSLLALTGIIVWWQGIQNWKRGLLVRLKSGWRRFNWDLHSAFGFWTLSLVLMWGLTGVFAAIPDPFRAAVEYFEPLQRIDNPAPPPQRGSGAAQRQDPAANPPQNAPGQRGRRGGRRPQFKPRVGDRILRAAYALHFGNFAGAKVKIAWVVLGLAPGVLFLTGLLMWINRKFRRASVN
jgi:uncharacterized iron-regulated membrane protein